ncbi:hypothetical protein CKAN_00370200 [Cinnamomum micranthum f. kanehirae]|uniref:Uncharacterized protein n=1 Tax=Cinnamomum micranthum f. kanehirae TaxID=337451 RepID=A0A443NA07_9MAGN|nr:hypothetical protein CKAN_00370200 [Cinnamomum micranthum f. kanehirae]
MERKSDAKESALKKVAGDKGKANEEYVGPLQSEMTPSKGARSSQTDVVTGAPESCPLGIDLASSLYVGPPVNPGLAVGAALPCLPPSVPSGEASKSSMPDSEGYGDSFEQGKQLGGSNSPRNEERMKYSGGNVSSPGVCVIFDVNLGFGKTYNGGGSGGGDFRSSAFGGLSIK